MAEETAISIDIIQGRNEWGTIRVAGWPNEPGLHSGEAVTQTTVVAAGHECMGLSAVCWPAVLSLSALLPVCPWGENDKITPEISVAPVVDLSSQHLHTWMSITSGQRGRCTHPKHKDTYIIYTCGYFFHIGNLFVDSWVLDEPAVLPVSVGPERDPLDINFLSFSCSVSCNLACLPLCP